jgi:hypothetical protein
VLYELLHLILLTCKRRAHPWVAAPLLVKNFTAAGFAVGYPYTDVVINYLQ